MPFFLQITSMRLRLSGPLPYGNHVRNQTNIPEQTKKTRLRGTEMKGFRRLIQALGCNVRLGVLADADAHF